MVKGSSYQSPQEFGNAGLSPDGDTEGTGQSETPVGGDSGTIDPATLAGPGQTLNSGTQESSPKKRGRKPGWRKPVEKASEAIDVNGLNKLIYSAHAVLSSATKIPELKLDEDESKQLAEATANLARHYNIAVSQKTLDWTNFASTVGAIYGTRIAAIINEKRKAKTRVGMAAGNIAQAANRAAERAGMPSPFSMPQDIQSATQSPVAGNA